MPRRQHLQEEDGALGRGQDFTAASPAPETARAPQKQHGSEPCRQGVRGVLGKRQRLGPGGFWSWAPSTALPLAARGPAFRSPLVPPIGAFRPSLPADAREMGESGEQGKAALLRY